MLADVLVSKPAELTFCAKGLPGSVESCDAKTPTLASPASPTTRSPVVQRP